MKIRIFMALVSVLILCGCGMVKYKSRFTSDVEPGMDKKEFISRFGEPYGRDFFCDDHGVVHESLYYKEELLSGDWYVRTTVFYFENSKLMSQRVIGEERMNPPKKEHSH